jgi:hypothetical protein
MHDGFPSLTDQEYALVHNVANSGPFPDPGILVVDLLIAFAKAFHDIDQRLNAIEESLRRLDAYLINKLH